MLAIGVNSFDPILQREDNQVTEDFIKKARAFLTPVSNFKGLVKDYQKGCKLLCNEFTGSPIDCALKPKSFCHDHCVGFVLSGTTEKYFHCQALGFSRSVEIIEPKATKP